MSEDNEHSETRETRETNNNDVHTYIHTYIREKISSISLPKPQNLHKVHVTLSMDESLHNAAKFIASYLKTDVSELYAQGLLKTLSEKVQQIPESIELNVTHTLPKAQNQPMYDLEADLMKGELGKYYKDFLKYDTRDYKIRKQLDDYEFKRRNFLMDKLHKTLPKALRLAQHSQDDEFKQLLFDVAEVVKKRPRTVTVSYGVVVR